MAAATAVAAAADTADAALSTVKEVGKYGDSVFGDLLHLKRTQPSLQRSDQGTGEMLEQKLDHYRCREAPHALAWLREFTLQVCLDVPFQCRYLRFTNLTLLCPFTQPRLCR